MFGVRAVLAPPAVPRSSLPDAQVEYSGSGGVVVSNAGALPPAFVAYGWRASRSRDASAFLMARGHGRAGA